MAEKSQALKYILIGVAITLGMGVCGVGSCVALLGGGAFWAYQEFDAPVEAAEGFLGHLRAGEFDKARERTSKAFRARHTPDAFAKLVGTQPALLGHSKVSLPSRALINGRATLSGTLSTDTTATASMTVAIEIGLVEEGGIWRIDQIGLDGFNLE